jgi:hypothetical protein
VGAFAIANLYLLDDAWPILTSQNAGSLVAKHASKYSGNGASMQEFCDVLKVKFSSRTPK